MYDSDDLAETKNCAPFSQTTCGKNAQKRGCIPAYMSTLYSVLCWTNIPKFAGSLQGTHPEQGPIKTHLKQCATTITAENVDILQSTCRGESFLLTLEALHIRELKPTINTKDEYRSRELTLKL